MIRVTSPTANYKPVTKYNDTRYRINFDKVDLTGECEGLSTWSIIDYFEHPTTEQVQNDVRTCTIQRYENEGLTPPRPEDIDVSEYIID